MPSYRQKSIGICIGAATVSFVTAANNGESIELLSIKTVTYKGNPREIIEKYLGKLDLGEFSVIATGRKYKQLLNTASVSEPEAVQESLKYLGMNGKYGAVASLGSENFIVYCLNEQGDITHALTGNKCAAGTGEFFLQQIGRMGLSVEEALELAGDSKPHLVSGRCSVFCKSDCTHALNKGIPIGDVVTGLCKMVADKIIELLAKQNSEKTVIIGGVSKNYRVVEFLKEKYPEIHIPIEAFCFEALGAALLGLKSNSKLHSQNIFKKKSLSFSFMEPLKSETDRVKFESMTKDYARMGDTCILGLDVGSTTTKAVIIRADDDALLASVYLRTNGSPIKASINCYKELRKQITIPINIIGLGTTGSGRHIAGLHALTEGIINEIIAHAKAAAFFNSEVDTIFEIGGQDAKYTYLTNGCASDYAMNEACSAGTGSFLEEAARESLGIDYRDISSIALKAAHPPNFNDQCAAFISSDIKNAIQEGISKTDIVGGLVYSVCMNYINRVKGNRPVGSVVFMQGGVCYNRAVPIAMSKIIEKKIIVPPEPGLVGAFGVALEVKKRIELGLMRTDKFDLDSLIERKFQHKKDFTCLGGREKCDLKCEISIFEVEKKKYPFGGACNKYYNQRFKLKTDPIKLDYVKKRQELVYNVPYRKVEDPQAKTVGISKSFHTNTYFPLYANFFSQLGFRILLSDKIDKNGINKIRSSFCYPVEISHCLFQNLLVNKPDYIFLPHIVQMNDYFEAGYKRPCVFVQGEPYYLKSAFGDNEMPTILSPVINFDEPNAKVRKTFIKMAHQLGKSIPDAIKAFDYAMEQQNKVFMRMKELGKQAMSELETTGSRFGMVLFGRPYNAFAGEANLGIPHKFSSKGLMIIPHDILPSDNLPVQKDMYWHAGRQILRGARFVKDHPKLYGVFITNFSCGPDSFILSYFRRIMADKPSLVLELDSHSADVGIDTRIDAAIDIINNHIELEGRFESESASTTFIPLNSTDTEDGFIIIDSKQQKYKLTSPEVELLIPSMGRFSAEAFAAALRNQGINAKHLPIPSEKTLKYGRSYTSCKECLPFILTAGQMIEYMKENTSNGKKKLFFMTTGSGPCRQGQYATELKNLINELCLEDIDIFTLTDENSYSGLGNTFFFRAWISIVIADQMHDIVNSAAALAVDPQKGLEILNEEWQKVINKIECGVIDEIYEQLERMTQKLAQIELKQPLENAKVISLTGEVYVRREEFSRMNLIDILAKNGFVVKTAPIGEYIYYCNYLAKHKGLGRKLDFKDRLRIHIKDYYQKKYEKKINSILLKSKLVRPTMIDIDKTIGYARHLISENLLGEGILTTGLALREIMDEACGVISIGPFACMPSRLAEAILNREMTIEEKIRGSKKDLKKYPNEVTVLPYLHFETDGNQFPQIIQSRIEIFMLQAEKLHKAMQG